MRTPYLALLLAGFTMPDLLPAPRWALTPPFHPYRYNCTGGLLSVALSLGSRRAGITRRHVPMEPGLSSPRNAERLPSHLVNAFYITQRCGNRGTLKHGICGRPDETRLEAAR